jgi:stage IV sporulation protein FB
MRLLGYEAQGILFNVYGAGIKTNNIYKRKHDIIISLSGPLVNIILIILNICLWWIFPTLYVFTWDFVKINFVVFLFNILPIYPLDGGRVLFALLDRKVKKNKLIKVNCIVCMSIGIFFSVTFLISIFYVVNFNLLFIGLFLLINGLCYEKNNYYEKVKAFAKDNSKPCEIKIFKVDDFDKQKLIKFISPKYYSVFVKYEGGKKIELGEEQLYL